MERLDILEAAVGHFPVDDALHDSALVGGRFDVWREDRHFAAILFELLFGIEKRPGQRF